tara:strand:- start:1813 stop:2715 length:903 start_codon:yes stop_codon:yes gene_type:complete
MGEIYNLFIGGGEPFLRSDLAEILVSASEINHVANVYIPTNGQHAERTVTVLERTLSGAPEMRFHLNLSIDHTEEDKHDFIRGKSKAYKKMLQTVQSLKSLRNRYRNLIVHTLTTIMKENQEDIFEIYEELKRLVEPDGISFNYCRGNSLDPKQTEIDPAIYERLLRQMEDDFVAGDLAGMTNNALGPTNHILDQYVRRSIERTVMHERAQFSCVAGRLAGVIYSDGDVVECEVKKSKLGNLRTVNYDFQKLWSGPQASDVARQAAEGCYCTHECGHYASIIYSIPKVVKIAVESTRTHR